MAEAAASKMNDKENAMKNGAMEAKPAKKTTLRRGKIVPKFGNAEQQKRMMQAMWDYNFGRKSAAHMLKTQQGDHSDSTFHVDETDPDLKRTQSSSDDDDDDTIHNIEWKKQQQARRHHKNYESPVSMEISSRAGKATVNDSAKDMSDDSILTRSQIAARQALRRKANYESPGDKSFDISQQDNAKELLDKEKVVPMRRPTLAPLGDYSAVLQGINTTEQSSKGIDASKRSEVSQTKTVRQTKNKPKQKSSLVVNDDGHEISAIINSDTSNKKNGRLKSLDDEDVSENLRAMGLPAATNAWKKITTSTPLSAKPPQPTPVEKKDLAAAGARMFEFGALQEATRDDSSVMEPNENKTMVEDDEASDKDDTMVEEENQRGRTQEDDSRGKFSEGPMEGTTPEEESALPVPALVADRSASANDLSSAEESIVPERPMAPARSAPPSPVPGRRYPLRNRKPKPVCRFCHCD